MNKTMSFAISLKNIVLSFDRMTQEAKWDLSEKMFWGYYFIDHDLEKIEKFGKFLQNRGYQVVQTKKDGHNQYILHIEENVSHTPESLFEQCIELLEFAKKSKIEVFDGWDVERENISKGLLD